MKKLIDVSDTRTRALQQGLMIVSGSLSGVALGFLVFALPVSRPVVASLLVASAAVLLVTASIKQRWELKYREHTIRFENSPVLAESLYLDEGLVARGGIGTKMELRAPIRVGEGAGEEIVALVDAGFRTFRLRVFVETEDEAAPHAVEVVRAPAVPDPARYERAEEDLRPVVQSNVLGKLVVAKQIFELIAALIAFIGAVGAVIAWLL